MRGRFSPKIFTWHIHGSYLYYLSQGDFIIYIPASPDKKNRNIGRGDTFPFGDNVIEVPAEDVKELDFDCILFQTRENYQIDQFEILSEEQRKLPRIYLEHDPPRQHPTDTLHFVDDPDVLVVHVTHFNRLMWDNRENKTLVVEHGVIQPPASYKGNIEKGIVVINEVTSKMHSTPVIAAGKTNLGAMGALLKNAGGLISNCTGVSHVAAALKTKSVVISMDGEPERWAPLNKDIHSTIDWTRTPDFALVKQAVDEQFAIAS